jgi:hypothetical protein
MNEQKTIRLVAGCVRRLADDLQARQYIIESDTARTIADGLCEAAAGMGAKDAIGDFAAVFLGRDKLLRELKAA